MDGRIINSEMQEKLGLLAPRLEEARTFLESIDDWVIQRQIELTSIPAPPFQEAARGIRMAELMEEVGLKEVKTDEAGNVIGRFKSDRSHRSHGVAPSGAVAPGKILPRSGMGPLILSAHLDTVFAPGTDITIKTDGARVSAPGICDDGRGLTAILAAAKTLSALRHSLSRDVLFVATVGEEGPGNLRGVRHLFRKGQEAAEAAGFISLDGVGADRIIHRGVGSVRLRITLEGSGGHSWMDFGLANPIHVLGRVVARAGSIPLPEDPRTSLTVARWGGGTSINAIPQAAWIEVDLRSEGPRQLEKLEESLRNICAEEPEVCDDSSSRREGLALRIQDLGRRPAGATDPSHPLVQAAVEASRSLGQEPTLLASSTDANLPMSLGIPAITLGAGGRGGRIHTEEEWFENENGPEGILRAVLTVLLFDLPGPSAP
jgi:acetylornithine deacetylase/succinyl-diaminopimelate desuccinylase-like protein